MKISVADLQKILQVHQDEPPSVLIDIGEGKEQIKISGSRKSFADMSLPCVVLLTGESTSDNRILATEALEMFILRIADLLRDGQNFNTCLREMWPNYFYQWHLVKS